MVSNLMFLKQIVNVIVILVFYWGVNIVKEAGLSTRLTIRSILFLKLFV